MRTILFTLAMFTIVVTSGCCTIMEKESYNIPLESSVPDTNVKVYAGILNHKGNVTRGSGELVATVKAPGSVTVTTRKSDTYTFVFDKDGYMPKTEYRVADVSKYIWGNIVFLIGCPIGLAVDSQTGANRTFSEAPVRAEMIKGGSGIQAGGQQGQGSSAIGVAY